LIGSVLDEQQRGEFVRTQHRFSPCQANADSLDGDWHRMAGPLPGGPQKIGREVRLTTVLTSHRRHARAQRTPGTGV
jgi:hypothetical protein